MLCSALNIRQLTLLILSTALLQGCQTLSASQCETLNWQDQGSQDASVGKPNQFGTYTAACDKHKIPLGQSANTAYQTGYSLGLQAYCQPLTVYKLAAEGRGKIEVCPIEQHAGLQLYWMTANDVYQARKQVEELIDQKESAEAVLADSGIKEKYKASAREQLRGLPRKIAMAQSALNQAEANAQRLMNKHL